MLRSLQLIYKRLLEEVRLDHYRFLYEQFSLSDRLTGLVGPRGVGKTTLLLQVIKNQFTDKQNVFYFSADHIYFEKVSLYAFMEELYLSDGIDTFFIDEIHQYKNWSQEIKNIYDGFPSIKIVFSGSSSLELVKGSHDLSRRAKMYYLPGMSFREYLNMQTNSQIPVILFDEMMEKHQRYDQILLDVPRIKGHFNDYLRQGFYPFYRENPLSYHEKILEVIDNTIYEDIANFYNLKTANLHHFKKILSFLTSVPPGTISVHNLSKNLSIDDKTATNYLTILNETGLINLIYPLGSGNQLLRRPEKIFLNNTNLQFAIEGEISAKIDVGTIRELFFIQALSQSGHHIFNCDKGDYSVDGYTFEIGGKNKSTRQIKEVKKSFLVKDDILVSRSREIPLMLMGFLY
jgi:predicted AAA+ superfamily ATPase